MRLTEKAQQLVEQYLQPGQVAIDATAGNGHDTCFLAQQVGAEGKVFAFDIQQQALDSTALQLDQQQLDSQVQLFHLGHQHMRASIPSNLHGQIRAVMFNLGYLPHGDKDLTTTRHSTVPALQQAADLLHPQGILSVLGYRGHPGGREETATVEQTLLSLSTPHRHLSRFDSPGPVLFILAAHKHV